MTKFEAFSFLFADNLVGLFLITPHMEFVFYAMKIFGGYNKFLMLLVGAIGASSGIILNWLFGNLLRSCKKGGEIIENSKTYVQINSFLHKYWALPLLATIFPFFGPVISTSYGLYKIPLRKVLYIFIPLKIMAFCYELLF